MPELTLVNGDCLDVMKEIPSKSIDLIICDLPYGCLTTQGATSLMYTNKGESQNGCAWDIKINLEAFWKEVKRIRKNDNTPTIHFCTTKFGYELIESNKEEFRYDLVWDKQRGVSFLSANRMPMRSHEMIYVFSKTGAFYNRKDIKGDFKKWTVDKTNCKTPKSVQYGGFTNNIIEEGGDGKRCILSVIQEKGGNRKTTGHPTEKPEELYKFLIERYCPPGGTVLDPTAGSFNSVFTAAKIGMHAIGIEKDKKFYEKGVERLNAIV